MSYTTTSKFLNILPYVLMEYQYSVLPTPEEYTVSSGPNIVGFEKIYNDYFGTNQILNRLQDVDITGNTRERSVVQISDSTFVDLGINYPLQYLDFDHKLTNTSNLSVVFPSNIIVRYDTIKFHFLSGYNFPSIDGVIFQVKFLENSSKKTTVSQILIEKNNTDSIFLNPNPIYFNGGIYDKYAEIKIPSISDMCYQFDTQYGSDTQNQTLASLISTDGNGFVNRSPFTINAYEINNTSKVIGYYTYISTFVNSAVINPFDEYSYLSAVLNENTDKNYWEYYPTWQGEFIDQFIYTENSLGNIYYLINEIIISEQIGTRMIETSRFQTIQTSGFDSPLIFRPIVTNSKATSFSIDYKINLVNKKNNTSIVRNTSITSMDVDLYGAGLNKIQLRNDPYPLKVYNKVVESSKITSAYQINVNPINKIVTKYVPSFFEMESINISEIDNSISNIGTTTQNTEGSSNIAYGQGNLMIVVNPFDNYYKFRIFNSNPNSENTVLDLGSNSSYYMVFNDGPGKQIKVSTLTDTQFQNPTKGELAFRIVESDSTTIQTYKNRDFHITAISPNGIETSLYYGTWLLPSERGKKNKNIASSSGIAGTTGSSGVSSNIGTSGKYTNSKSYKDLIESADPNISTRPIKSVFDVNKDNVIKNIVPSNIKGTTSGNSSTSSTGSNIKPNIDIVSLSNSIAGDEALGKSYKDIADYYTIPGRPGYNTYKGITKTIFLNGVKRVHPNNSDGTYSQEYINYSLYLGVNTPSTKGGLI